MRISKLLVVAALAGLAGPVFAQTEDELRDDPATEELAEWQEALLNTENYLPLGVAGAGLIGIAALAGGGSTTSTTTTSTSN